MAAVRCRHCEAVVTAHAGADAIEITYGASFLTKCKVASGLGAIDFVGDASQCPHMDRALRQAAFRMNREGRLALSKSQPDELNMKRGATAGRDHDASNSGGVPVSYDPATG